MTNEEQPRQPMAGNKILNFTKDSIKVNPESLISIAMANDVDVANADQTIFIDFLMVDPAYALGRVDTDKPLTKDMVSRVAIGPDTSMELMIKLVSTLLHSNNRVTLVINGGIVANNDEAFGPVVRV